MAHSSLNLDGQPLDEGKELLAVVLKDSKAKSFFIKVINTDVSAFSGGRRWHGRLQRKCSN